MSVSIFLQGVGSQGEKLGPAEFMALLHAAGADSQYATSAWVTNHYRLIVWKLARYECQAPHQLSGRALTPPVILDQLKYRHTFPTALLCMHKMHPLMADHACASRCD
jgi:breast cancer 2 susceptibility protein